MKYFLLIIAVLFNIHSSFAASRTGAAIAPPKYEGYIIVKGDMGWNSKSYKNSKKLAPPLLAHELCDDAFPGTRSAEYDDFKYIFKDLPSGNNYAVLDPYLSLSSGKDKAMLKTGRLITVSTTMADNFCQGYTITSSNSSYKTTVLNPSTGKLQTQTCNFDQRIACVKE
ncbi:MAG TPA: hypothetical protein DCL21_03455 [Alphaproteobacteria bacterium]|nr:hypothetical protein [Alphaproteobacteria bacterium]